MTDYDDLPFSYGDTEPSLTVELTPRKHRHRWVRYDIGNGHDGFECSRCGRVQDLALSRRGKSSRRLGHDQERRAERVYGWEKIGERGQMTDLRGRMFKVQQKASRRQAPALFRAVFPALDATRDQRIPAILLSFVKAGVGTEDYVVIRGRDWLDLHGRDEP